MGKKVLIVYYSFSNGNTKKIAEMVQKVTDGDIKRIDTVIPYPESYDEAVKQGQDEVNSLYRPEIKPIDVDIALYDVIVVGTPVWWYTMAPAVLTFLTSNDWRGKTVIPFMTNGGWATHVINDMKKVCNGAEFALDKGIQFDSDGGDRLVTKEKELQEWLKEIKEYVEKI